MRGDKFKFHSVQSFLYKSHKINFYRGGSYIYSLDWIKNKRATINLIKEDDECIQYAAAIALSNEKIEKNFSNNIEPFTF